MEKTCSPGCVHPRCAAIDVRRLFERMREKIADRRLVLSELVLHAERRCDCTTEEGCLERIGEIAVALRVRAPAPPSIPASPSASEPPEFGKNPCTNCGAQIRLNQPGSGSECMYPGGPTGEGIWRFFCSSECAGALGIGETYKALIAVSAWDRCSNCQAPIPPNQPGSVRAIDAGKRFCSQCAPKALYGKP